MRYIMGLDALPVRHDANFQLLILGKKSQAHNNLGSHQQVALTLRDTVLVRVFSSRGMRLAIGFWRRRFPIYGSNW